MKRSALLMRRTALLLFLASLIACDSVAPPNPPLEDPESFLQTVDGLAVTSMQDGSQGSRSSTDAKESPYGCFVSVLDSDTGAQSYSYRSWSIYLHFQESVIERAKGLSAGWFYRAPLEGNSNKVVRLMNCVIPQSREAADLMKRLVGRKKVPNRHDDGAVPAITPNVLNLTSDYGFLDGDVPNPEGYVCPTGYDWLSQEQDYCVDENGNVSLPHVVVIEDPSPPGGGDPGDDDPCWWCEPGDDPCDDPTGLCYEDGNGGGYPPIDPCTGNNPPVYCTNPCNTGEQGVDSKIVQLGMQQMAERGRIDQAQDQRLEDITAVVEIDGTVHVLRSDYSSLGTIQNPCEAKPRISIPAGAELKYLLHLHPFSVGELITTTACPQRYRNRRYGGLPSVPRDSLMVAQHGVPMIMIDKDGVSFYDGSGPVHQTTRWPRCGF